MFIELLRKRRSIRKFTDQPVEQDTLDVLLESLLRSPYSGKAGFAHFIVIEDKATLSQLAQAKPHGAKLLENAPLAIVICSDATKGSVWIENASIAAIDLQLAATDLGLGSCWVQFRDRECKEGVFSKEVLLPLLGLGKEMDVLAVMAIGYPAEEKVGRSAETLDWQRISYEKFGGEKE